MRKYAAKLGEDVRLILWIWKALRNPRPIFSEPYLLSVESKTTIGVKFELPLEDYKKVLGVSSWHELAQSQNTFR